MPKLMLKFEAAFIKEIKLDKPAFTLGRKPDNDIVLDNAAVSGHHAKMYESGGTWFVEDLNSTNGTFVNNQRVTAPTPFGIEDTLRIGRTMMSAEK